MAKILLAEDDPGIRESIGALLSLDRHAVDAVDNGESALDYLKVSKYDLLILDWQMPKVSGVEVCTQFRQSGGTTPILILTAREKIDDKEVGFASGADDYQTKPFSPRELRARINALLRRGATMVGSYLQLGAVEIDLKNKRVTKSGEDVSLRPIEFAMLEFFLRHPSEVISPEQLLQSVWSAEAESSVNTVYTSLTRLRKKLDPNDREAVIQTVHGYGYRLVGKPDSSST